jgi:hypothetical protein
MDYLGEPYCKAWEKHYGSHKFVDVRYLGKPVDAFTVIKAQCPSNWVQSAQVNSLL